MLIEQIVEIQWSILGPLDRTCTLTTDYFHVKTKISKTNLRVDYYLLLKYLQNLTPNVQNHKRIFDQIISERRIEAI